MSYCFKCRTICFCDTKKPKDIIEGMKQDADIIADDDNFDLSHVKIGETVRVFGRDTEKDLYVLNIYQRVKDIPVKKRKLWR